ncbi:hypothetical protein ACHAXT_000111 [Thalassiosira profunda]
MTITSDFRPASPLPGAMLSNPDLRKLYMSSSCPELQAESVISSDEEGLSDNERFAPLEAHDESLEGFEALSMDHREEAAADDVEMAPAESASKPQDESRPVPIEAPALPHGASSISSAASTSSAERRKLNWKFRGLTLWLELEEYDGDLTTAVEDLSSRHSSPRMPIPHTTAIYGMEHLTPAEAKARLHRVKAEVGPWPAFARPTGVTSDVAVCGRPGQVCDIAWSELTLASDAAHEAALDRLYGLFYGEEWEASGAAARDRPWKPHNSIAYDNPETNALSLLDTITYLGGRPTLLGRGRRVEAMSLWNTEGTMEEWECLDRVRFW